MYRSIIRTAIHRSDIQATTKQERPSSEVSVPLAQITPDISPSSICCFFKKFRQPFSLRILSRIPWTDPWTLFFNVSASRKRLNRGKNGKSGRLVARLINPWHETEERFRGTRNTRAIDAGRRETRSGFRRYSIGNSQRRETPL